MPTKTTKKPTTTKTSAKKTTVKKSAVKQAPVAATPAPQTHNCPCGHECKCGDNCKCNHGGCRCGRFFKKLIIALIIFAMGFAAARFTCGPKMMGMRGPRAHFVNGCLDATKIKCPKLLEALPAMDINQDGCITRDEFHAVKREMRREIREMPVQVTE